MGIRAIDVQDAVHAKKDKKCVDRVEKEIEEVLHRIYPTLREVIVSTHAVRGGVFIQTESKVWVLRARKGWIAGLYRAAHSKDFHGLSRRIEAGIRQSAVHAEIQKWLRCDLPRIE